MVGTIAQGLRIVDACPKVRDGDGDGDEEEEEDENGCVDELIRPPGTFA